MKNIKPIIKDERVQLMVNKYAAHAFYIVFFYSLISGLVKLFILDLDVSTWFDHFLIVMLACGYLTFRLITAGVETIPTVKRGKRRLFISSIIGGIISSGLYFVYEYRKLEEVTNELIMKLGFKSILFFLIWTLYFYFFFLLIGKITKLKSNKLIDEE